jgi:putative glutamine amidotransferase
MSAKPVIGLSMYREQTRFRVWDTVADVLPARYATSVELAGGIPVLLPEVVDGAVEVVARLDGLVICGGNDVDPSRYGASPHQRTTGWRPERDAWELALLDAADAAGLPTLGICRGMQVMAVWAGGRLNQHVPDEVGHHGHSPGSAQYGSTEIKTAADSTVQALLGDSFTVSCHHHQSVAEAPGFLVTAEAPDGTPEAMEAAGRGFWLGVQWHPEVLDDLGLFQGLVRAAQNSND